MLYKGVIKFKSLLKNKITSYLKPSEISHLKKNDRKVFTMLDIKSDCKCKPKCLYARQNKIFGFVLKASKKPVYLITKNYSSIYSLCLQKRLLTYSKNGQVNQQASADRPVSSLLGLVRTLQLVVDPS